MDTIAIILIIIQIPTGTITIHGIGAQVSIWDITGVTHIIQASIRRLIPGDSVTPAGGIPTLSPVGASTDMDITWDTGTDIMTVTGTAATANGPEITTTTVTTITRIIMATGIQSAVQAVWLQTAEVRVSVKDMKTVLPRNAAAIPTVPEEMLRMDYLLLAEIQPMITHATTRAVSEIPN